MGHHREFLADEISMVQSDNQVLRQENDLLRMTSERKGQENETLKDELLALRAAYALKIDEAAALRTILEGVGHNVSAGLQRFMERRQVKDTHVSAQVVDNGEQKGTVVANYREEQRSDQGAAAYAPPAKRAEAVPVAVLTAAEPPPAFLRRPGQAQMRPIDDSRIPMAPMSDAERDQAMRETLSQRSTMR
jgi:hypothetical protein